MNNKAIVNVSPGPEVTYLCRLKEFRIGPGGKVLMLCTVEELTPGGLGDFEIEYPGLTEQFKARAEKQGVSLRTLIDQINTELLRPAKRDILIPGSQSDGTVRHGEV